MYKSNQKIYYNKGLTLIEILISMSILLIMLGAVVSVLNIQRVKSEDVATTTILQTDAQIVLSLFKWDLAMAGLCYPKINDAVRSVNGGTDDVDTIRIHATGLGFEENRWSYLIEAPSGATLKVRRWNDANRDLAVGDTIVVIDGERQLLSPPGNILITARDTFTFFGETDTVPGYTLTIDKAISASNGLTVVKRVPAIYDSGLTITLINNQLLRGNEALIDNVEDIQFAYGIDNNNDGVIETWTDNVPAFATLGRKWTIRYTLVLTSQGMPGYRYAQDDITIEDHTYTLADYQKSQKRVFITGTMSPQNLQP